MLLLLRVMWVLWVKCSLVMFMVILSLVVLIGLLISRLVLVRVSVLRVLLGWMLRL